MEEWLDVSEGPEPPVPGMPPAEQRESLAENLRRLVKSCGPVDKTSIYALLGIPEKHKGTRTAYRNALNQEIHRGHILCDEDGMLTLGESAIACSQAQYRTMLTEARLREYFAQGRPGYIRSICDELGISVDAARRHMRRMGATYTMDGKRRVWRLPDAEEPSEAPDGEQEGRP